MNNVLFRFWRVFVHAVLGGAVLAQSVVVVAEEPRFIDHSLLVAPEYPCTWPSNPFPRFQIVHQRTIGADSPYNVDVLLIDGNTGTQLDVPPHSVARPELKREKSGPLGLAYTDKIEPWQFGGEACVVDVRSLLDQAPNGVSSLVKPEHIKRFEQQHHAEDEKPCRGAPLDEPFGHGTVPSDPRRLWWPGVSGLEPVFGRWG